MNDVCYIDEKGEMRPIGYIEEKDLMVNTIHGIQRMNADPEDGFEAILSRRGSGRIAYDFYSNTLGIKKVIFHDPATIVYWKDGTKTVVKCSKDDKYSKEAGLAFCIMKKLYGNGYIFHGIFKKYCSEED